MKVIKTLVTLSIINAVVVMGVVASRGKSSEKIEIPSQSVYTRGFSNETLLRSVNPSPLASPSPVASAMQSASTLPRPTAPTPTSTPIPNPTTSPTPTPTPLPIPTSGCIVTIDGISYNVDLLRSTHSGGDIFECGSDMANL